MGGVECEMIVRVVRFVTKSLEVLGGSLRGCGGVGGGDSSRPGCIEA